jgi:hypothetical protein
MKTGYLLMALVIIGLVITTGCAVDKTDEGESKEEISEDEVEQEIDQTVDNLLIEEDVELGEMI